MHKASNLLLKLNFDNASKKGKYNEQSIIQHY